MKHCRRLKLYAAASRLFKVYFIAFQAFCNSVSELQQRTCAGPCDFIFTLDGCFHFSIAHFKQKNGQNKKLIDSSKPFLFPLDANKTQRGVFFILQYLCKTDMHFGRKLRTLHSSPVLLVAASACPVPVGVYCIFFKYLL